MNNIIEAARELAAQLLTDVNTAANRVDHIRLTTRANEAAHLVELLERLEAQTNQLDFPA
jgi:hypothetical protein